MSDEPDILRRTDVLALVKPLPPMPNGMMSASTAAEWLEVPYAIVGRHLKRNVAMFAVDGVRLARGEDRRAYLTNGKSKAPAVKILNTRALVRLCLMIRRSPIATKVQIELGQVHGRILSKEYEALRVIRAAFAHLPQEFQRQVGPYFVDLYLPSLNVAVECDELGHRDRSPAYEAKRQKYIESQLGCRFVRFDPDASGFNIGAVINQLLVTP